MIRLPFIISLLAFVGPAFAQIEGYNDPLDYYVTNNLTVPTADEPSMLTYAPDSDEPSFGEPINIIISNASDAWVLSSQGFADYMASLNQSESCLGQVIGGSQMANLNDGKGLVNQTNIYRENFGDTSLGTCQESMVGGNHVRFWNQSTTGAIFVAASVEQNITYGHNIVTEPYNGYDLGRDWLKNNATAGTSTDEYVYQTSVTNRSGLLPTSSIYINHNLSLDGIVYIFEVQARQTATQTPEPNSASSSIDTQHIIPLGIFASLSFIAAFSVLSLRIN